MSIRPTDYQSFEISDFERVVSELTTTQKFQESFLYYIWSWLNPQSTYIENDQLCEHFKTAATIATKILKNTPDLNDSIFKQKIAILFKEVMPKMSIKPFSRENKLPKEIQHFFNPNLKTLREEKELNPALIYNKEHKLLRKKEKAHLSFILGIKQEETSSTHFIKDIHGKCLAILKGEDVPFYVMIINWFKACFGGQLYYLSKSPQAQFYSERAAYLLSESLGLNIVPATEIIKDQQFLSNGSLQLFVSKEKENLDIPVAYQTTKEALVKFDKKEEFSESEVTTFQKFAIFDYLIGNLDRHEENWFVTLDSSDSIVSIAAIDNANAFPIEHPKSGTIATHNQYKWKMLKIAKEKFTQNSVDFVKSKLGPDGISTYMGSISHDMEDFLNDQIVKLFKKRASLLYKFVTLEKTSEELGNCFDDVAIERFLESTI